MAIQTINLGTYANDRTGDDLRTAFQKVNANLILKAWKYGDLSLSLLCKLKKQTV
jgi:hypothetical protein